MLNQMVRRLRQLHHQRLSEWLSKTSFQNTELKLRRSFLTAKERRCHPRNITTEPTPIVTQEKEQVVESVDGGAGDGEFVLNETILDRLKKLVPDKNVGLEILLGVSVLIGTLLLLWSIRLLVRWCLEWKNRRKGYRNVEYRFEETNSEEFDLDEEFRKYCHC
jgi:hypothetical protein